MDSPSVQRLTGTVAALAADPYAGRRVGSPGGRAAAEWLAGELGELGATVGIDEFVVPTVRDLYAAPILEWNGQRLVHRRDFVEHLVSCELSAPRPGRLVNAAASDWHDRWVLADAATTQVSARAVAQGAAGLLVPRGTDGEGWMPKMIAGPHPGVVPVVAVRADLHSQMVVEGGTVAASMPIRTVSTTGTNVHGLFTDPAPGALSVLLVAHFDGVGDDPDVRLPAAGDNASGVAVVLEAARLLTAALPDRVGLAVVFVDAEEAGALGSAYHAPQVPAGTYVVNIDGAAQLAGAAAVEAGGPAEPLLAALDSAARQLGIPLRPGAMPSDNRRYAAAGLPAIGIGMGIPGYQTPAETPDRVEAATLIAAAGLVVATVRALSSS